MSQAVSESDLESTSARAYAALATFYRKVFRLSDVAALDVTLATVVTSDVPGDPLWSFLVGPPSSSKTEVLRPLDQSDIPIYYLSTLTNHALVSGLKGGTSLLAKLHEKTLVVKDFTPVMEMSRDKRDEILGDLRDAYDGTYAKAFGTVGTLTYVSHFNFLAGVTNAI